MKFGTLILGVVGFFMGVQGLQKTQEEAHKFLIDNGHVTAESTVETFQIDREGNVRLQVEQGGKSVSYGLQAGTDTYEIVYMNRAKTHKKRKTESEINADLEKAIGEKFSILKGGKIGTVNRSSTRNRNEFEAQYILNEKSYIVSGRFDFKRGDVSINTIQEATEAAETTEAKKTKTEL